MNSEWYAITQVAVARLAPVVAEFSCLWLENPPLPLDLKPIGNKRALFIVHRGDKVLDQPGQVREKRRLRLLVGAVALTTTPLRDADELHFAARMALRGDAWRAALFAAGLAVGPVREVELEPELKDVAQEGSALTSAFEIEYFQTYGDTFGES
jgi:hypothetical protein